MCMLDSKEKIVNVRVRNEGTKCQRQNVTLSALNFSQNECAHMMLSERASKNEPKEYTPQYEKDSE